MFSQRRGGPTRQSGKAPPSKFRAGPRRFLPIDDPLVAIDLASDFFQKIEEQGRQDLSKFLQWNYQIASVLRERPEEFEKLMANEYFEKFRQRANPDEVERFVLRRTMNAADSPTRSNRSIKYFAVLADYRAKNVADEEVAELLKAGGGVDEIYEKMPRQDSKDELGSDDGQAAEEGDEKATATSDGSEKAETKRDEDETNATVRGPSSAESKAATNPNEFVRVDKRSKIILDSGEQGTQGYMTKIAKMKPGAIVTFRCKVGESDKKDLIPLKLDSMDDSEA